MPKVALPSLHAVRLPTAAFFRALQGAERVAGVVIEYNRIRYAEFERAHDGSRILVGEGAVSLPEGTIRAGTLARPDALTEALRKLAREGKPSPLTTPQIILGSTVTLPAGVAGEEAEGALRLEIESTLPFSLEESYTDWQPIEKPKGQALQEYLFVGARISEIEPYIHAAEQAGLGVVSVEPVTLSMARGLVLEQPMVTYLVQIYDDALLGVAMDEAGNVRYFHHRSLPAISVASVNPLEPSQTEGSNRAQRIALELAAFIRFLKEQFNERPQQLVVDGMLNQDELTSIAGLSETLGIPVVLGHETHLLSRAAARGVALRGMLPRSDDALVSLMAIGTEQAYLERQASFFVRVSLRMLVITAVLAALLLGGTWGFTLTLERRAQLQAQQQLATIPAETREVLEETRRINAATSEVVGLLSAQTIPDDLTLALVRAAPGAVSVDRVFLRLAGDSSVSVDLSVEARLGRDLLPLGKTLETCFANDPQDVRVPSGHVLRTEPTPFVFTFTLKEDYCTELPVPMEPQ